MSTITQYLVQAKKVSRWETLGPFEEQEEGDQAFRQILEQHEVTYARLLGSGRSADGEPFYQVLRVFQRRQSGQAAKASELARPVVRAAITPAAPDESELERPQLPRQLESLQTSVNVLSHNVVYYQPGEFSAWPANNGGQAWHWGNEILVGFLNAVYEEKEGHNWAPPSKLMLARSTDSGETWTSTDVNFGGPGPAPGSIDFAHPDFALRVRDQNESYYISYDRGHTWPGPYGFGELFEDSPVAGDEFTSRTDYIANSSNQMFFFMSSRREFLFTEDYSYMAKTDDGGANFDFVSFMDPFDIDRNVMPSTVRVSDTILVSCTRRKDRNSHWIECYRSNDNGESWSSSGQVDSTGEKNGNPPALVRLANGGLVCVYGVRQRQGTSRISAKVSSDNGSTWSPEQRLRDDYVGPDAFGDVDLGYPRAFVRPDGKIVTVYYWATLSRPEQHIAATVFQVVQQPAFEAGQTSNSVTDAWYSVTFASGFSSQPVVLASIQTFDGHDTAGIRIREVSNAGFSMKLEEEQSADEEVAHTTEVVGYFGIEGGNLRDGLGTLIGEAGKVTVNQQDGEQWHTVNLRNTYSNPVVVMQLMTFNGHQPAHTRLRNVGRSSFEYQIEEWDYLDQFHVAETIGYLVIEGRRHRMADGAVIEAGKIETNHDWATVSFGSIFLSSPVTLSHCQTYNGHQAVVTREQNVSVSGFEVRLQEEEGNDGMHLNEIIGYVAVQPT